jgi:hypothetical protein
MGECFVCCVPRKNSTTTRNADRKAEIQAIREFAEKLIRDGKAKQFLVDHGFVKQSGGLTKRYGG